MCPVCNTLINRIEGCSHMFCVNCKANFDWNSLKIIKYTTNELFH